MRLNRLISLTILLSNLLQLQRPRTSAACSGRLSSSFKTYATQTSLYPLVSKPTRHKRQSEHDSTNIVRVWALSVRAICSQLNTFEAFYFCFSSFFVCLFVCRLLLLFFALFCFVFLLLFFCFRISCNYLTS